MKRIPRRQRRLSNVTNKLPNIELKMLMYFIHSSVFSRFSKRYLSLDILSVTKSMSMLSHPASSWSSWSLPPELSWLWQSKRNLSALAAVRSSNKNSLYALVGVSQNFFSQSLLIASYILNHTILVKECDYFTLFCQNSVMNCLLNPESHYFAKIV